MRKALCILLWLSSIAKAADFPPIPTPQDNPLTAEKIALGRQLFYDPILSRDRTISCSTCHDPERGFTDNLKASRGIGGKVGIRNAPTIVNACFQQLMFHDGRALLLESQALGPIQDAAEMGNTLDGLVAAVRSVPYYRTEFAKIFGRDVTAQDVAKAIAAFERTIISSDAPIDRFLDGQTWALNATEKRGFAVFKRVGCAQCHKGSNFRDGDFHNTGTSVGELDEGRFTITRNRADFKKFKTPTLREIAKTAPYFHNGSAATLSAVVEFYDAGGGNDPQKDSRIRPLGLTAVDKADLTAFLQGAFSGANYPLVIAPTLPAR